MQLLELMTRTRFSSCNSVNDDGDDIVGDDDASLCEMTASASK